MLKHFLFPTALLAFCSAPVPAQFRGDSTTFRPRITGSGNAITGECKIRVRIDDEADVIVEGDRVMVRTLRGRPGIDAGSECTGPLPRRIREFDFRQTDGPGRAELIDSPERGGRAVIHVRDSDGGDHKYTLEFRWTADGGGGSYGRSGRGEDRFDEHPGGAPLRRGGRFSEAEAMDLCREAVQGRIASQYSFRDARIENLAMDDGPGRRDRIVGEAIARRGGSRARFSFSCSVDFESGRLRDVQVRER